MRDTVYRVGLYLRLSKEDVMLKIESMSIETQRKKLIDFANKNSMIIGGIYADDGLSGVFFDRPQFEKMMREVENGTLNCVIVKDLSRLGRNDVETNYYYEDFFLARGIRFIAIDDEVDTIRGYQQIATFKNMYNAMYPRDISIKTRSAYKTKAEHGEFLGSKAPYGYKKSPEDKHILIKDEETAPVIEHIFELALKGYGRKKIARTLREEKILTPAAYAKSKGNARYDYSMDIYKDEYLWNETTVIEIITNEVYIGNCVNHKKTKPFKSRTAVDVPKDEWIIVEGTHEPIISKEVFDEAQKLIKNRRRSTKDNIVQMFSGLVKCKECGRALSYNSNRTPCFMCGTYRNKGKEFCSSHYITYDELYAAVLLDIHSKTQMLKGSEQKLYQAALKCSKKQMEAATKGIVSQINKCNKRIDELEAIIKKAFESAISSLMSEERFAALMPAYEKEQAGLKEKVKELTAELDTIKDSQSGVQNFMELIPKYIGIRELNAVILNELIDHIEVGESRDENGEKVQEIEIYYKFAGLITLEQAA